MKQSKVSSVPRRHSTSYNEQQSLPKYSLCVQNIHSRSQLYSKTSEQRTLTYMSFIPYKEWLSSWNILVDNIMIMNLLAYFTSHISLVHFEAMTASHCLCSDCIYYQRLYDYCRGYVLCSGWLC